MLGGRRRNARPFQELPAKGFSCFACGSEINASSRCPVSRAKKEPAGLKIPGRRVASPSRFQPTQPASAITRTVRLGCLVNARRPFQFRAAAKPRGRRDAHTILRTDKASSGTTETDAEPTDTIRPIARRLTRPQGDRGHKLIRTIVARPGVPNAPSQIECRFFSDQQNATAALSINGAAGRRAFIPLRERARAAESAA